jgi:homeobox protein ESX1
MRRMDKPEPPPEPRGKPRSAPPLTPQPAREPRPAQPSEEVGGPKGPEPTRYGDWERKGRVTDF